MGICVSSPAIDGKQFPDVINASKELFQPYLTHLPKYDERMEVSDRIHKPYNWIGNMTVHANSGQRYSATGFKIILGLPTVQHQAILTSGHAVFFNGSYAKSVSIKFPDQVGSINVPKENLWAPDEFTKSNNLKYDFGVMLVPSDKEEGFRWTTLMSDNELEGRPLSCCGYSSDKSWDSLWFTSGAADRVCSQTIGYMFDSKETTSGSPIYSLHNGSWEALGVQSHGGITCSAIRITTDMMRRVLRHAGYPLQCTLKSKNCPDLYLCTNMNTDQETATISCQIMNDKVEPHAVFEMIPLVCKTLQSVAISPLTCPNMYLTLKEAKRRGPNTSMGEVKLADNVYEMSLQKHNEDGTLVSIELVTRPGLFMSIRKKIVPAVDAWSNRFSAGSRSSTSSHSSSSSHSNASSTHNRIATCCLVRNRQEISSTELFVVSVSQCIN